MTPLQKDAANAVLNEPYNGLTVLRPPFFGNKESSDFYELHWY
jgi:hypothetical protein